MTPEKNTSSQSIEPIPQRETNLLPEAITNYTTDLTQMAAEGKLDPVIGRNEEIQRVIQILGRRTKNNPVLIGEAGVGKTAVVEGLAQLIALGKVPTLQNKRILRVDLTAMIAGAAYRGEFEERINNFLREVKKRDDVIIFIDELHTIIGAGAAEGQMDVGNILKPALARGELSCIGATTIDEYRKHIEKDAALARRFQHILVEEPSEETAINILRGLRQRYETHHHVKILDEALAAAVKLSSRYIQERFLPDKAVDLLDEACSAVRIKGGSTSTEYDQVLHQIVRLSLDKSGNPQISNQLKELRKRAAFLRQQQKETREPKVRLEKLKEGLREAEANKDVRRITSLKYVLIPQVKNELLEIQSRIPPQVTANDVAEVVRRCTGIPVAELLAEESAKLANMENSLKQRIIGQDEAIEAVARTIRRQRTGLSDPNKPPSLLFLGPTGVGKTELARALAEFLFGDKEAIIRIDMSEYQEKHSVARLIGAPPGYAGYEEGGQLTEAVKCRPYSVVLLDEAEKAHPDFFNALLQVLDAGRLTDGKGKTFDFRNVVVIMTSNLKDEEAVRKTFRPEFCNRLGETVVFHSLSEENMEKIVELRINELAERMAGQNLRIEISQEVKDYLTKAGYDSKYGARPLERLIVKEITDIIASMKVEGKIKPGQKVSVDYQDGQIQISVS